VTGRTRWAAACILLPSLAHALEQALLGAAGAALLAGAAVGMAAIASWCWLGVRATRGATLRAGADGALELRDRDGLRQVALRPDSARLGGWLLLHLVDTDGRSIRLLLGPGLEPDRLAALRRRLRRPPTVPGPLL
jgi:hypothetical protein